MNTTTQPNPATAAEAWVDSIAWQPSTTAQVVGASLTVAIENVGKQYTRTAWGLRDVSLALGPGVLGLLGPNGAGKSTLMRILATITKPTTGRVTGNGTDIARAPDDLRAVLGYLPQDFGVYPHLNAVEFLEYMAAIKGLDAKAARRRIDELLEVSICRTCASARWAASRAG
jgi:ABC-type multidrug transport system ATPase subunit